MAFDYDLFVIGAGPGGLAAARLAAQKYGVRVAIAEKESLGGTCVNRGCVPKKLMVYAADFTQQARLATSYGWRECQQSLDWSKFLNRLHCHLKKINESYQQKLKDAGVTLIEGKVTFVDKHTLEVANKRITAEYILIAVGGKPFKPDLPGREYGITSREMFHLEEIPKQLAIIGGGYIGVEFSSIFQTLGSQVTLIETNEDILSGFDHDICSTLHQALSQRGIRIITNASAKAIENKSANLELHLSGDCEEIIVANTVLIATGRVANTKDLGLEKVGIELGKKGVIPVNEYSRTSQDSIFAVGDCAGHLPLTPVAKAEAKAVVHTIFGNASQKIDYTYVPSGVFSRPEAATVGLTEAEAREKYGNEIHCFYHRFQPLLYSLAPEEESTPVMVKLVLGENEKIIGLHMVGEDAADIVQSLAVAIRKGITKLDIQDAIAIHPTVAEELLTLD